MTVSVHRAPLEHLPWLAERAKVNLHPNFHALEAVKDGRIVAMVGFEPLYPCAGMLHIALEYPSALRHVLHRGFQIAFADAPNGFGWVEAFAPVKDDNRSSLFLVEHLGFKKFHHGKGWMGDGVGLVWFGMLRGDCRFLGKEGA